MFLVVYNLVNSFHNRYFEESMSFPLIPFENFTVVTYKSKEDIVRLLSRQVDRVDAWQATSLFRSSGEPAFHGSFVSDRFSIRRKISYKNDFNPILEGRIRQGALGALIDVKIHLPENTLIFTSIWLISTLAILILVAFGESTVTETVIAGCVFLAGYILPMAGYVLESMRSKKVILGIVNGTILKES